MTPQEEWHPEARSLRREFLEQRLVFRVFLVIILTIGVLGGLGGGLLLSHEVHHWAWAFTLLFLEPVGLACLLSLVSFAAPDSIAMHFLDGALRRASRAASVGLLVYLVVMVATIIYAVFGFVRR